MFRLPFCTSVQNNFGESCCNKPRKLVTVCGYIQKKSEILQKISEKGHNFSTQSIQAIEMALENMRLTNRALQLDYAKGLQNVRIQCWTYRMAGRFRDETDMGGERDIFLTTHWSLIEKVGNEGDKDRALIASLLENYWKPVYCYLRHKGYGNEDAKDLTQGFFHEVVLDRNLVQRADPAKGRFRSFLLHALNQYLINERDKRMAQKRIPPEKTVLSG
jgi:hypothetical protein